MKKVFQIAIAFLVIVGICVSFVNYPKLSIGVVGFLIIAIGARIVLCRRSRTLKQCEEKIGDVLNAREVTEETQLKAAEVVEDLAVFSELRAFLYLCKFNNKGIGYFYAHYLSDTEIPDEICKKIVKAMRIKLKEEHIHELMKHMAKRNKAAAERLFMFI